MLGSAADKQVRHPHGAGREAVPCAALTSTVLRVGSGIVAGLALTLVLNKVLARWAEGSSRPPLILLAVTVLLSVVAAIASAVPARRASEVDPMTALRCE